ncbi:MAG: S-adenosylmethionine:tRNA ribosyltransferase-isomerase [Cytophagales bacterium]|nr:MAG: S-adenosylmethionine:tRNA ribosyltransferase-isomerase [Cytophagales bacterium]
MSLNDINLADYTYELPEERIANFPLEKRDESKLLVFQNEQIAHHHFKEVVNFLTSDDTLFFNDTKVIPARLYFQKETGAIIEIFLLNPISPTEVNLAMTAEKQCTWACAIGNLRRIKEGSSLNRTIEVGNDLLTLKATLLDYEKQFISFEWEGAALSFAELLALVGQTPLPPYIKREVEESDKENYQTVYAKNQGAVAAPTAGLHFTEEVLAKLQKQGVKLDYLTLHVAGGTFQPIRHDKIEDHQMHAEQMIVSKQNVENLINSKKIVAVGTTSMRTLESLYWYGIKLMTIPDAPFQIKKLMPYRYAPSVLPNRQDAFTEVLNYMTKNNLDKISGETEIMIVPSYPFHVCDALITNFHLSGTTLILLVAAFVGEKWREIYAQALANQYRFLSFGDSSLLFRSGLSS